VKVPTDVLPGDVLAVDTGTSWGNVAIRVGQLLADRKWSWSNHLVMAHHVDDAGTLWGVEGRPGGVGWVDLSARTWRHLSHNAWQPKTEDQRRQVCEWGESVLQTPYDWSAIVAHAMDALGIPDLWRADWSGGAPAQVVCSSVWAYGYSQAGLSRPLPKTGGRYVRPADWQRFCDRRGT
jgi:hypothetical protein